MYSPSESCGCCKLELLQKNISVSRSSSFRTFRLTEMGLIFKNKVNQIGTFVKAFMFPLAIFCRLLLPVL